MHTTATFSPLSASPVNAFTPNFRAESYRPALSTGRTIKQRLEACRGFDLDDDEEFCPVLINASQQHQHLLGGSPRSPSHIDTEHYSPTRYFSSPKVDNTDDRASPDCAVPAPTLSRLSPRGSKALLIIDPSTGRTVSSPMSSRTTR